MDPATIDAATAEKMMAWGIAALCLAIIPCMIALVAIVRCNKNTNLTKTQRWMWQLAHLILMFPAFAYLIFVDRSRSWKIVTIISLIITIGLGIYVYVGAADLPGISTSALAMPPGTF